MDKLACLIDAVKENVADIKSDVARPKDNRFSDLLWHIGGLVALGLILGGMFVAAYFRIEDRINGSAEKLTRIETKLDDLLERIPKAPVNLQKR